MKNRRFQCRIGPRAKSCWAALSVLALAAGCTLHEDNPVAPSEPEPGVGSVRQPLTLFSFDAGSLVIPMDNSYQDRGTLKAFGLVFKLIRNAIPVYWTIQTGKAAGGVDFVTSGRDLWDGGVVTNNGYRGGPFVIDVADREAAMPIIQAWHDAGNITTVHDVTVPFSAEVRRKLNAAPRLATFVDGNELIAFTYLNAAGITDSDGGRWPLATDATGIYAGYPDVLSAAKLKGDAGVDDGLLLRGDGTPRFCQLTSMHYAAPADLEVVREVRRWLSASVITHAFMECEAVKTFENADGGRFLSTGGVFQDSNTTPSPLSNIVPDGEFSQFDGTFTASSGSMRSLGTLAGSSWRPTVQTLMNKLGAPLDGGIVWLTGHIDGDPQKGKVTYLTGHSYTTTEPISTNPRTNGVRLFLDSLFESTCASDFGQPSLTLTKSAPSLTDGGTITYDVTYRNGGPGYADNAVLRDAIPDGGTFVSATGGGTFSSGVVSWSLGNIKPDAGGTVSLTVAVSSDDTYLNRAAMSYMVGLTPKTLGSNETSTVRDTVPPDTSITASPAATTDATIASFSFTSPDSSATFECQLDWGGWNICTSAQVYSGLAEGSHAFQVRAIDAAGNIDATPATWSWTVEPAIPDAGGGDGGTAPNPDAGLDAGADAAVDAGLDAGTGAVVDAGTDAAVDAGLDAGTDAVVDAGTDAAVDAGLDAGFDAGTNATVDAGLDVGFDAGTNATVDAGAASDGGPDTPSGDAGTDEITRPDGGEAIESAGPVLNAVGLRLNGGGCAVAATSTTAPLSGFVFLAALAVVLSTQRRRAPARAMAIRRRP